MPSLSDQLDVAIEDVDQAVQYLDAIHAWDSSALVAGAPILVRISLWVLHPWRELRFRWAWLRWRRFDFPYRFGDRRLDDASKRILLDRHAARVPWRCTPDSCSHYVVCTRVEEVAAELPALLRGRCCLCGARYFGAIVGDKVVYAPVRRCAESAA